MPTVLSRDAPAHGWSLGSAWSLLQIPGTVGLAEIRDDFVHCIARSNEAVWAGLCKTSASSRIGRSPPCHVSTPACATQDDTIANTQQEQSNNGILYVLFPAYFPGSFIMRLTMAECAVFAIALALGSSHFMPSACCLYALGASWGPAIAAGGIWRLVAPIFLHASLPHLGANALFQLRFGYNVERELGTARFGALYFLSGVCGNLVSASWDPWKLAVGASTSGLGLLGASVASVIVHWDKYPPEQRRWLVILALIMIVLMFTSHTDVYGHLGGFVGGFCLMLLLSPNGCSPAQYELARFGLAGIVVPAILHLGSIGPSAVPLTCLPDAF